MKKALLSAPLLAALGAALFFPPALLAEPLTVCILQAAPTSSSQAAPEQSDAATLAPFLSVAAGPNALTATPVAGIAPKDMDAEAHKRGCAWIVELQRGKLTETNMPFDRSPSGGISTGPLLGISRSGDTTHIEFTLRKTGSKKISGRGSSNKPDWAALFPAEILQKLAAAQ